MIDITIYLATVGILSSIIIAFVIHNLKTNKKDYESQQFILKLQKQIENLVTKDSASQTELTKLKTVYDNLQRQINKQKSPHKRRIISSGIENPDSWINKWRQ